MIFSNIDFTVKYVDPSAAENGDGVSPETPLNVLPAAIADLADNTCYLIRRTPETSSVLLPRGISNIQNILFVGMPKNTDAMWLLVPQIAQEAWGFDVDEYANIVANTGTEPYGGDYSFQLTTGKVFLMHRIYLFRDNTPAYMPIIKFPTDEYAATISLEHCKFGAKGVDINLNTYTEATTSNSFGAYINVNTALVFAMHDCIVNMVSGNDYYGSSYYPISLNNARFITASDVTVYATTRQYGDGPGGSSTVLCFSNGSWTGAVTSYQNLKFNILINKNWGYAPQLFFSFGNDYCELRNVTVGISERKLGTESPSQFGIWQPIIRSLSNREFKIENIEVNLPKFWRIESSGRAVSISGWCNNTVPGHSKIVKNITINLAETDGVDSDKNGNYYDWIKDGITDPGRYSYYAALELSFSERSYSEGAWEPVVVSGITVNHPHGNALYAYGCQIRECVLKGTVKLRRCIADISTLETYYPGYALFAAEATTLKVGALTLGKENAVVTGGADDPAVGSRYSDGSFIYVGNSNGTLKSNTGETATDVPNSYNFICGNEVDTGHYTCRSINYTCDTWNARRIGGAPAVFKFTSSANGSGSLSLGRSPFQGLKAVSTQAGFHTLTLHIAAKGISSLDELNRKLLIQLTIPRADGTTETMFSAISGQWQDDSAAEWINDSEMEQRRFVIPVMVMKNAAVDIKVHYQLYSATGYVYIDPALELTPVM